jgi:hypothetical protein
MRETCARVLAAALMTGAVAFAVALPALVGPTLDPGRPLTAPPSSLRRSVPVTPHKAAATRPAPERLVSAHPIAKSTADTALARFVSAPRPNLGELQPASVGKPQGRPAPAPTPAPTPAPEPQPTPPPETDTRELASATPAAPAPPPAAPPPGAGSEGDREGKGHWKDSDKGHDHDRWQSEDEDDNDEQESGDSCDPPVAPDVVTATPTTPAVELPEDGNHDHGKGHWKDRGGHDNQDDD